MVRMKAEGCDQHQLLYRVCDRFVSVCCPSAPHTGQLTPLFCGVVAIFSPPSVPWPCFFFLFSWVVCCGEVLEIWSAGPFPSSVNIHLPNPVFVGRYRSRACWSIKYRLTVVQICSPWHHVALCSLAVAGRLLWATRVMHTLGRLFTAIVVCI